MLHQPHNDHVIVSRPNHALVVPRNGRTSNLFPDALAMAHADREMLVVPHDLRSTICLRAVGYQLPNPMLVHYDWVGGKPFAVQRATCDLMTTSPRCYVLN